MRTGEVQRSGSLSKQGRWTVSKELCCYCSCWYDVLHHHYIFRLLLPLPPPPTHTHTDLTNRLVEAQPRRPFPHSFCRFAELRSLTYRGNSQQRFYDSTRQYTDNIITFLIICSKPVHAECPFRSPFSHGPNSRGNSPLIPPRDLR